MLEASARRHVAVRGRRREAERPAVRPSVMPTVLCVEDHPLVLISLKRAFLQDGWRVVTAVDGEAALAVLRGGGAHADLDTVLADVKLPGITGLEVIKTMWSEGIDAAPVIYTAFPDELTAREAATLGIEVVSKLDGPSPVQLPQLVRGVIERRRARRRETVEEVARFLATAATQLAGQSAPSPTWRPDVAAAIARTLADPAIAFATFLTIAEALRFVQNFDESPRTVATFLRLQAERCLRRSEVALTIRLDQMVARLRNEHRGRLWKLAQSHEPLPVVAGGADVDAALRAMGWSQGEIVQAVALRHGAIRVADTKQHTRQIAYELGIEHPPAFNRFFKHLLGLSPSKLRELLRSR